MYSMYRLMPLLLALLLPACSLTPGMQMKAEDNLSDVLVPVSVNGKMTKAKLKIVPITADLIIERENVRQGVADTLPPVDNSKRCIGWDPTIGCRLRCGSIPN